MIKSIGLYPSGRALLSFHSSADCRTEQPPHGPVVLKEFFTYIGYPLHLLSSEIKSQLIKGEAITKSLFPHLRYLPLIIIYGTTKLYVLRQAWWWWRRQFLGRWAVGLWAKSKNHRKQTLCRVNWLRSKLLQRDSTAAVVTHLPPDSTIRYQDCCRREKDL